MFIWFSQFLKQFFNYFLKVLKLFVAPIQKPIFETDLADLLCIMILHFTSNHTLSQSLHGSIYGAVFYFVCRNQWHNFPFTILFIVCFALSFLKFFFFFRSEWHRLMIESTMDFNWKYLIIKRTTISILSRWNWKLHHKPHWFCGVFFLSLCLSS